MEHYHYNTNWGTELFMYIMSATLSSHTSYTTAHVNETHYLHYNTSFILQTEMQFSYMKRGWYSLFVNFFLQTGHCFPCFTTFSIHDEQSTWPHTVEHKLRDEFFMVAKESKHTRHDMVGCSGGGGLGGACGIVICATLWLCSWATIWAAVRGFAVWPRTRGIGILPSTSANSSSRSWMNSGVRGASRG